MSRRQFAAGAALGACLVLGLMSSHEVRAVAAALVNVTNTAANPVPVRSNDELNAFATRVFPSARTPATFVVPAGKRLVITSVTGFNNGPYGSDVSIDVTTSGGAVEQRLPFQSQNAANLAYLQNSPVRMVADPGSTVYCFVTSRQPASDFAGYNIDVKGYYVDAS